MKYKIIILLCAVIMILGGCSEKEQEQTIKEESVEIKSEPIADEPVETESGFIEDEPVETEPTEDEPVDMNQIAEDSNIEEPVTNESQMDDTVYIGEYLDENASPELEIAKREDGKYIVQIGIFRLTSLEDGVGELTEDGMTFTATDASGNPISGVITVENQTATVTFTDSTWEYLPNGSAFEFTKSSDIPNIWSAY